MPAPVMSVVLSRYFYFPISEFLKGRPVSRRLREFEALQWLAEEELKPAAAARLAALLEAAAREVPFYRGTLGFRGKIRPEEAGEVLRGAPVLSRSSLAAHRQALSSERRQRTLRDRAARSRGDPEVIF